MAAGVTVVLWTRGPSYSLLYANIAAEDQSAIAQALDAAQIPYRIQPGSNNIEVASERVERGAHEARRPGPAGRAAAASR